MRVMSGPSYPGWRRIYQTRLSSRNSTRILFARRWKEGRRGGKKGMMENRDEGDRREGTTRTRNARPQTMEFYLVKNFPACRCSVILSNYTPDPLPLHPAPHPWFPVFPSYFVISRNLEVGQSPSWQDTGGSVNRFRMERKTGYTVQGVGNGRRSSSQAKWNVMSNGGAK